MILIDTSVMIDFLKGKDNLKTDLFSEILKRDIPYGLSSFTYQEILQGSRDKSEFEKIKSYLSTQKIYYARENIGFYEKAALLYFNLRRSGITTRSTIDILIAVTAIENNLILLHNDRDFDIMSEVISELKTLETI